MTAWLRQCFKNVNVNIFKTLYFMSLSAFTTTEGIILLINSISEDIWCFLQLGRKIYDQNSIACCPEQVWKLLNNISVIIQVADAMTLSQLPCLYTVKSFSSAFQQKLDYKAAINVSIWLDILQVWRVIWYILSSTITKTIDIKINPIFMKLREEAPGVNFQD